MKTNILFLAFTFAILSSCNNKKETEVTEVKTDSIIVDTPVVVKDTVQYKESTNNPKTVDLVRAALQNKIFKADTASIDAKNRKFIIDEIDLNNDGKKEIFVGFNGMDFCGNAGCDTYLLSSEGDVITKFTIVQYPIVISDNKSKDNWQDLIITSRGVNYLVKWNGKKYPSNPSMEPKYSGTSNNDAPRVLWNDKTPYPWFKF